MYPRGTEILNRRQITIVSVEELERIAEELGVVSVLPEWLGANLLLKGFSELTNSPWAHESYFQVGQD